MERHCEPRESHTIYGSMSTKSNASAVFLMVPLFTTCITAQTPEAVWRFFRDDINDGYDTTKWISSQPWSKCAIGTVGASYPGGTQHALALSNVCAGVWILRRRNPDLPRPFRTPLVPLVPILGIVISLAMMLSLTPIIWIRLTVWLIMGMVIYFGYSRHHSRVQRSAAA